MDPALFHPGLGEDPAPAKAVCVGCAVCSECLEWALQNNEMRGVWGGTSAHQREQIKTRRSGDVAA